MKVQMRSIRSYVLWNRTEVYREGNTRAQLPLRRLHMRIVIDDICVENTEEPIQNANARYADMGARYACNKPNLARADRIHRIHFSS